jgi:hypothetical protein
MHACAPCSTTITEGLYVHLELQLLCVLQYTLSTKLGCFLFANQHFKLVCLFLVTFYSNFTCLSLGLTQKCKAWLVLSVCYKRSSLFYQKKVL